MCLAFIQGWTRILNLMPCVELNMVQFAAFEAAFKTMFAMLISNEYTSSSISFKMTAFYFILLKNTLRCVKREEGREIEGIA